MTARRWAFPQELSGRKDRKMERISIASPILNGNEKKYVDECIDTGWISANGRFINEFEACFAEFCGTRYALACCNGTVTLHLALKALGIGPGDEVIMPTLTYIATANAVKYCGADPVFVDSEPGTWNIDPLAIEEKVTESTKAIIPVHLYGLPCNMDAIREIAEKHGLAVVEDAAEAHGARWRGEPVGSMGAIGSFSFFGNKIITCGEGGMLTTNDEKLYNQMKLLRSQGVDPNRRYWHTTIAYNYRMTNLQAAVGLAQLENVAWHLEQRRRVAGLYQKYLPVLDGMVSVQEIPEGAEHVYWMNSVLLKESVSVGRDAVMAKMENAGIEMRPLFYPMHAMPPYEDKNAHFPVAESLSARGINLPSHGLLTEEQVRYIVNNLRQAVQ